VPETGWKRFLLLPLKKAWQNKNATGIKPKATMVLESGAIVMHFTSFKEGTGRLLINTVSSVACFRFV
jgi:hypothetical protein